LATVFVWQNHFVSMSGAHTWTGHSSLSIDDIFVDSRQLVDDEDTGRQVIDSNSVDMAQTADNFVSFWPGSFTDRGPKNARNFSEGWKIGAKFMAKAKPSIYADVALEGYAPDHVIRINGLNLNKMKAKWRSIRNKNKDYKFLRNNCSTAVAHVLQEVSVWYKTDHHLVWTPCDVRDYALKIGTAMLWGDFIDELEAAGVATTEQLDLLRRVQRRRQSRGTSGGTGRFA
jgi:hypothetical protein